MNVRVCLCVCANLYVFPPMCVRVSCVCSCFCVHVFICVYVCLYECVRLCDWVNFGFMCVF